MSQEITFLLEPDNGKLTTEVSGISTKMLTDLRNDLGSSSNVNCGKPGERDVIAKSQATNLSADESQNIWLYRIYHNSVADGPGRRSVIQVAGCSIRCDGCYVPETHDRHNGRLVSISSVVREILSNIHEIDGVTILGGEPFDQPGSVAELVSKLKRHNLQILVYSGNTIESLIRRHDPCTDYILTHIDQLIDGPFELAHVANAFEYRGSSNQRILSFGAADG